jgi:hypothetical protein
MLQRKLRYQGKVNRERRDVLVQYILMQAQASKV